jgi:hypothetical protein
MAEPAIERGVRLLAEAVSAADQVGFGPPRRATADVEASAIASSSAARAC